MKENKNYRKDNLSPQDSTKRVYKMYKKKKNWVVAPIIFGLLAPNFLTAGTVLAEEVTAEAKTEEAAPVAEEAKTEAAAAPVATPRAVDQHTIDKAVDNAFLLINSMAGYSQTDKEFFEKELKDADAKGITNISEVNNIVVRAMKANFKGTQSKRFEEKLEILKTFNNLTSDEIDTATNLLKSAINQPVVGGMTVDLQVDFNGQIDNIATQANLDDEAITSQDYDKVFNSLSNGLRASKQQAEGIITEYRAKNELNSSNNEIFAKQKEQAIKAIKALKNLDNVTKDKFVNLAKQAKNKTDLDTVLKNATDADTKIANEKENTFLSNRDALIASIKSTAGSGLLSFEMEGILINQALQAKNQADLDRVSLNLLEKSNEYIADQNVRSLRLTEISKLTSALGAAGYLNQTEITQFTAKVNTCNSSAEIAIVHNEWVLVGLNHKIDSYTGEIDSTFKGDIAGLAFNGAKGFVGINKVSIIDIYKERINAAKTAAGLKDIIALIAENAQNATNSVDKAEKAERVAAIAKIKEMKYIEEKDREEALINVKYADNDAIQNIAYFLQKAIKSDDIVNFNIQRDALYGKAADFTDYEAGYISPIKAVQDPHKTAFNQKSLDTVLEEAYTAYINALSNKVALKMPGENLGVKEAKRKATQLVGLLPNLTGDNITKAYEVINAEETNTFGKVQNIMLDLIDIEKGNKVLLDKAGIIAAKKEAAIAHINGLGYLSDKDKASYIADVNLAESVNEINEILGKADIKNGTNKQDQQDLDLAKSKVIKLIRDDDSRLSDKEREAYYDRIANAMYESDVYYIRAQAGYLDTVRALQEDVANNDLGKAKTDGSNGLKKLYLDGTPKGSSTPGNTITNKAITDMKASKTPAEALALFTAIYETQMSINDKSYIDEADQAILVHKFATAQEYINKIQNTQKRNEMQTKLETAMALAQAKGKASDKIQTLMNVSKAERNTALNQIKEAKTIAEVNSILNAIVKKDDAIHDKAYIEVAEEAIKARDFDKAAAAIAEIRDSAERARLTQALEAAKANIPTISYRAHVQNHGWMATTSKGYIGTVGQAKRIEAFNIKLAESAVPGSIEYRAHVQNIGWQGWVKDGATAGTTGKAKRVEAVNIRLTGELANKFDVYYRAHVESIGWQKWSKNGQEAGTTGKGKRVEALEIQLVKKGDQPK